MLERGPVVLDGGLATELERLGHDLTDRLWSARVLRDSPADIEAVHRAFFEAGADVAITASYQATFEGLGDDAADRCCGCSVELARRARDAVRPDGLVAASVGPYAVAARRPHRVHGRLPRRIGGADRRVPAPADRGAARGRARPARVRDDPVDRRGRARWPGCSPSSASVEAWMTFCCRDGERLSDGTPVEEAVAAATAGGPLDGDRRQLHARRSTSARCSSACAPCTDLPLIAIRTACAPIASQ